MCTMIADMTMGRIDLTRVALRATVVSSVLLAAACTTPVERDDAHMATTPEQQRSAPTQPAVRPQEAAVESTKQKTATTASKEPAAPAPEADLTPAAPPAPAHTVAELMGKRQAEVTDLMGAPARIEQRAASTVWVYQGSDCGLDVFFFLDMATSDERVLTVAPSAEPANAAKATAPEAPAGTEPASTAQTSEEDAVDACYGKLRRS